MSQDPFQRVVAGLGEHARRLVSLPIWSELGRTLADRAPVYARLMRLDRPIGTLLLLWPTLWALWLAGTGHPRPDVVLVFVLGVVLMRAAGCVINDYADRNLDGHVRRTRGRPLATGEVSPREALSLFAVLALAAFLLVLSQNALTVKLSFVGLALAATYPFMKRYTYLPQLHLGIAFGWAVPMSFAAQTGAVPDLAWLVLIAVAIWAVVYDTLYAMVDRPDDLRIGIKSSAILFGDMDRHIVGLLQGLLLFTLYLIGRQADLGTTYHLSLLVVACLFARHLWMIRRRELDACFRAFLENNLVGMTVFIGILLDYTFLPYREAAQRAVTG